MSLHLPPPALRPLSAILPSEPLLLMGAGPVPIPDSVARANGVVIDHLGAEMGQVIDGIKDMARYAFQTEAEHVLGLAGPGSGAMEMAIANLCWPGRRVLALVSGTFSARLGEMARGVGADVTVAETATATPVTAAFAREALAAGQYDVVTIVQGETSCGVVNAELPEICKLAKDHGALMLVDTVCTLTTMPLQMDAWGIDACVTGGQKGLSSIPGVSLIAFSDAAWEVVESRPGASPHWCYDARRAWRFWGQHAYHYTAPVPGLLALYEALRLISEETLTARFARHHRCTTALQQGLEAMGLELFVPAGHRLPTVIAIRIPDGVDGAAVRHEMAESFSVQISGAFGLPIVRIGQMGEQCRAPHILRVIEALGESLQRHGKSLDVTAGKAAAEQALQTLPADVIFHACTMTEWQRAEAAGSYAGSSQDQADGFIHFSNADQVRASCAKHRAGQTDLILVAADPARLGSALRYEPSRAGALFPHLYGELPLTAVISTWPLLLGADGAHVFPAELQARTLVS